MKESKAAFHQLDKTRDCFDGRKPSRFDRMEKRILKMLKGWTVLDVGILAQRLDIASKTNATLP